MTLPRRLPPIPEMIAALIAHWTRKSGTYRTTSDGIEKPIHGGEGGTFKEINERRARGRVEYYTKMRDALKYGGLSEEITEKLKKDYKRIR